MDGDEERENEAGKEEENSIKEMWCVNLMRLTEEGVGKNCYCHIFYWCLNKHIIMVHIAVYFSCSCKWAEVEKMKNQIFYTFLRA